jgi:hypothetical protein
LYISDVVSNKQKRVRPDLVAAAAAKLAVNASQSVAAPTQAVHDEIDLLGLSSKPNQTISASPLVTPAVKTSKPAAAPVNFSAFKLAPPPSDTHEVQKPSKPAKTAASASAVSSVSDDFDFLSLSQPTQSSQPASQPIVAQSSDSFDDLFDSLATRDVVKPASIGLTSAAALTIAPVVAPKAPVDDMDDFDFLARRD